MRCREQRVEGSIASEERVDLDLQGGATSLAWAEYEVDRQIVGTFPAARVRLTVLRAADEILGLGPLAEVEVQLLGQLNRSHFEDGEVTEEGTVVLRQIAARGGITFEADLGRGHRLVWEVVGGINVAGFSPRPTFQTTMGWLFDLRPPRQPAAPTSGGASG